MILKVLRYGKGEKCTLGLFLINREFACYTLEDEIRDVKVPGETCIPDGIYEVRLRTVGGKHEQYLQKFGPDFHKGMLWIMDVPNYDYILIHIGNDDDDTEGCLTVQNQAKLPEDNFNPDSTSAYKRIYPIIVNPILNGERVFIQYETI